MSNISRDNFPSSKQPAGSEPVFDQILGKLDRKKISTKCRKKIFSVVTGGT